MGKTHDIAYQTSKKEAVQLLELTAWLKVEAYVIEKKTIQEKKRQNISNKEASKWNNYLIEITRISGVEIDENTVVCQRLIMNWKNSSLMEYRLVDFSQFLEK